MTITRREFLQSSAITAATLATPTLGTAKSTKDVHGIFLMLVGGPSQIDTFDPKPDAPSNIRGPFNAVRTRVAGTYLSELFPRLAAHADEFSIIRSLHHTAAPIHETGLQLLQTGSLSTDTEAPHWGALLAQRAGHSHTPANILLPAPIGFMGVNIGHGQSAGTLAAEYGPQRHSINVDHDPARDSFGRTAFGDDCLRAARLIEQGTRFVTVNMFTTVYDTITWDCHAAGGSLASSLHDYRLLGASFDVAYTALLQHLKQRGLLDNTLVVATGELGRTPHINRDGGRDHWAGVWSALVAGAGIPGGEVLGSSDALGAEPKDQPYSPAEFAALMRDRLGL